MATSYELISLRTVGSTQDEARGRFRGAPVVVVAAGQDGGRGRSGRAWWQAPRALAVSLAFQPSWPVDTLPRITLVAGLAAADVLQPSPGLKWPNDLLDGAGGKIGGILTESSAPDGPVVVGMGVNLWWPDAPAGVAGLLPTDPGPGLAPALGADWAETLLDRVASGADHWGRDEYTAACTTLGAEIVWEPNGSGTAIGVAADGALEVETAGGRKRLVSGEVRQVRPATLGRRRPDPDTG